MSTKHHSDPARARIAPARDVARRDDAAGCRAFAQIAGQESKVWPQPAPQPSIRRERRGRAPAAAWIPIRPTWMRWSSRAPAAACAEPSLDSPAPIDVLSGAQLAESGKIGLKEIFAEQPAAVASTCQHQRRRHLLASVRAVHPARPQRRPGAVPGERQAATHDRADQQSGPHRARIGAGRPGPDPQVVALTTSRCKRDGASAQYGSDAIAGVINIILKSRTEGGRRRPPQVGQNHFLSARARTTASPPTTPGPSVAGGFIDFGLN